MACYTRPLFNVCLLMCVVSIASAIGGRWQDQLMFDDAIDSRINLLELSTDQPTAAQLAFQLDDLRARLQSLRVDAAKLTTAKLQADAALAAASMNASMNASMLQLEVTALSKMREALLAGVDKIQQQEAKLSADAADAATEARETLQQRATLQAQRDAILQRLAALDKRREDAVARVTTLSEDIKALEAQLGKAQADLTSATKAYIDREKDLKQLVENADSELKQLVSGIKGLADEKDSLGQQVEGLDASVATKTADLQKQTHAVSSLEKQIEQLMADTLTRTQAAERAEQQVEVARSAVRKMESELSVLAETNRDLQLRISTAKEDTARAQLRAKELADAIAFSARQRDDQNALHMETSDAVAKVQGSLDALRTTLAEKTDALTPLRKRLGQLTNETILLTAHRDKINNATKNLLVEAASVRIVLNNVTRLIPELRAEEKALKAKENAQKLRQQGGSEDDVPIPEEVLTALHLGGDDPTLDVESTLQTGPSEDELAEEFVGHDQNGLARFREMRSSVDADSQAVDVVSEAKLADLTSQVTTQQTTNDRTNASLVEAREAIKRTTQKVQTLTIDKSYLAQTTLDLNARFNVLRERVMRMRDAYYNTSDVLAQAREEMEDLKFNLELLQAREKSSGERTKAAEDEVVQTEKKRREVMAAIAKAADERVTQTQVLKLSINQLLSKRRTLAHDITEQEAARLILAQQVDFLKQRVQGLTAQETQLSNALTELQTKFQPLKRKQEIAADELRLATERQTRATEGIPAVSKERETLSARLRTETADVASKQLEADAAELQLKAVKTEVERLVAERTSVNARIAEIKLKVAALQQDIIDKNEAKALVQIQLDNVIKQLRGVQLQVNQAAQQVNDLRADIARAVARKDRAASNLEALKQRLAIAQRTEAKLLAALNGNSNMANTTTIANATAPATATEVTATAATDKSTQTTTSSDMQAQLNALQEDVNTRVTLQSELEGK